MGRGYVYYIYAFGETFAGKGVGVYRFGFYGDTVGAVYFREIALAAFDAYFAVGGECFYGRFPGSGNGYCAAAQFPYAGI